MLPDAEVLKVCTEILSALPIGAFTVKLNHRKLLDASLALAGIPPAKFRTVCSSIDKLDKEPWAAVREELVGEKGVLPAAADAVGVLVQRAGAPLELLGALEGEGVFAGQAGGRAALADLALLFKYLQAMGALQYITLDLSLARGLDYYTGVIYEAVLLDPTVGVGSIAAGGRYDALVGMFSPTGAAVPCVGVSIGVERVFTIMEAAAVAASGGLRRTPVEVWVASIPSSRGKDMALERMRVLGELWGGGYSAEALQGGGDPKLQKQLAAALEAGCPYVVVLGEDELDAGTVQLKALASKESFTLARGELLAQLAAHGAQKLRMGLTA